MRGVRALIIGLTGGIATGKSRVSDFLISQGLRVIDADKIAHQLVQPDSKSGLLQKIAHRFGKSVITRNSHLDRAKLAQIIFSDAVAKKDLEAIMHPAILQTLIEMSRSYENNGSILFWDVPLLFESGMSAYVDKSLLVYASREVQLERLMRRNNLTREDAVQRINSQLDIESKKQLADDIIDNSTSFDNTLAQLKQYIIKILG